MVMNTADARPLALPALPVETAGALVVGYSGGLDSTVLLHRLAAEPAMRARGLRAVHVHHGLQAAADAWANHCEQQAGALGVPRIHFGVGTANLLDLMGEAGADVVGVDWRTPLERAIPLVGDRGVQGNLDPTLVFAPTEVMLARAAEVIEAGRAAKGHVFNLGHGVLPSTDPDQLARLTEFVQSYPLGADGSAG